MKENVIARRYARGLAEYAVERGELESVLQDLETLADLLDPNRGEVSVPELLLFLQSPTVALNDKVKMTDILFEKLRIGKTVSGFLNILIDKGRVALTGFIAREFERLAGEYAEVQTAVVETARPLTEAQQDALRKALAHACGADVRLLVHTKPELLSGARVRMGDMLFDGSVQSRLARLEAKILE